MLTRDRSIFEGVYTLAKFYLSRSPDGKMNCISRSLGKFSIIDRDFEGTINDQDIWVCQILREIHPRQNCGAFVLRPIERVEPDKVKKIIPGFYDAQPMGKVISIIPNTDPHDYWMLSKNTRKIFSKKYHAVVVPIAYKKEEKIEKPIFKGEQPEMIPTGEIKNEMYFLVEPMQAKIKSTQEIIKVVPKIESTIKSTESLEMYFMDVISKKVYFWKELEPVEIKADHDSDSIIAPVINARFGVSAKLR